jgi:hypothetical protein
MLLSWFELRKSGSSLLKSDSAEGGFRENVDMKGKGYLRKSRTKIRGLGESVILNPQGSQSLHAHIAQRMALDTCCWGVKMSVAKIGLRHAQYATLLPRQSPSIYDL